MAELLFALAEIGVFYGAPAAGQHLDDALERAEFFDLSQLVEKILKGEVTLLHSLLEFEGGLLVDHLGGFFDKAHHVAHAEDARRHPVGVERLELVELFTGAGKLDRLACNFAEAESRAAACVAVELGQDRAGDAQRLVKMRSDADRLLPRGSVEHEQNFARLNPVAKPDEFLHHCIIDLQPAGGVENDHVDAVRLGLGHRAVGDLEHVLLAAHQETWQTELLGQGFELIHRGGAVNIRANEQRFAILVGEQAGEFSAGGGFAGAVQAAHHEAEWLCEAAR